MTDYARSCGSCTLCCKVLAIHSIKKPSRTWCPDCLVSKGCTIYDDRPEMCRGFYCLYISGGTALGEHWLPSRSKMIVCSYPEIPRIEIQVDDGRSDVWRREPFYSEIKAWARAAQASDGQVMVCLPDRTIVILPHKEVDLGVMEADDRILGYQRMSASGPVSEVEKVKVGDPRLPRA